MEAIQTMKENVDESGVDPDMKRIVSLMQKIFEEVSLENLPWELQEHIKHNFSTYCTDKLQNFWTKLEITNKLQTLRDLAANGPKEPAWRPTTGEAPVNAIQAGCYNNIKEELQKYLAVLEEKNARMKDYITKFHNKTENQLKEINSIETAVSETED